MYLDVNSLYREILYSELYNDVYKYSIIIPNILNQQLALFKMDNSKFTSNNFKYNRVVDFYFLL